MQSCSRLSSPGCAIKVTRAGCGLQQCSRPLVATTHRRRWPSSSPPPTFRLRFRDPAAPEQLTPAGTHQTQQQQQQQLAHEQWDAHDSKQPVRFRARAVVIGAGPAGATAAMYLAAAGYQVDVVERRGHPGQLEVDKRRTYLIGLGERGLSSLDGLGITIGPQVGRRMQGSVYAYKSGKRIEDPFTPDTRIIGVDRQGLTAFLVDEATRRYSPPPPAASHNNTEAEAEAEGGTTKGAITFHFNTTPHINLQQRRVSCVPAAAAETAGVSSKDSSQEQQQRQHSAAAATATATTPPPPPPSIELQYDLLVGADGAGSTVRTLLEQALPQHVQVQRLTSPVGSMEYKAFTGLPWNEDILQLLPAAARGPDAGMTFFALNNPQPDKPNPGSITLYCLKDWAGTMYLPEGTYSQLQGVSDHEAAIRQFTPEGFPEGWVTLMAQQMTQAPPSRISPMYLVSHLAAPQLRVVLIGDAAHCVTPQMGQGCNSALEDCALLAQALQGAAGHDIATGLAAFERTRARQVHALQHMEEENAWVRRPPQWAQDPWDKSLARVAWISFFMLLPLLRALPGMKRVVHASLFQNIMSSTVPYDTLHTAVRAAPFVWAALLAGVFVAGWAAFMGGAALIAATLAA